MACSSTSTNRKVSGRTARPARSTTRTITRDRAIAEGAINPNVRKVYARRVANYERARKRARR